MSNRSTFRRRAIRAGVGAGIAAVTVLGLTSTTASAATRWEVVFNNGAVPSGTGSVKLSFPDGGGSACAALGSGAFTHFNPATFINGGQTFYIQAFGDSGCSGSPTGSAIRYLFSNDTDVAATGKNCSEIAVHANGSGYDWLNCIG